MKTKISLTPLCALLLTAFLIPNVAHAEMDALVRDALALADSGRAKEAYAMLEPFEVTRAGDPDFDTVFGIAANQSGEHARAVMALERATIVQPGNTRARAELGRAMFAVGDSKSARALLEQAKAQGAPAEAALTIDQFLRAIDVAEGLMQSSWRGYVEASIGHDSNISVGPQKRQYRRSGPGRQCHTGSQRGQTRRDLRRAGSRSVGTLYRRFALVAYR